MQNSLAIIGAGRVGRALGRRLRELGWKIGAVVTRSEASARKAVRFIGAGKPCPGMTRQILVRSEEHTSELQSHHDLVCRLLLEKKKKKKKNTKISTKKTKRN